MTPPRGDLRGQAIGWARHALQAWQERQAEGSMASSVTWDLLSHWGRLLRMVAPSDLPADLADSFARLSSETLQHLHAWDAQVWIERVKALDAADSDADFGELTDVAQRLFDEFDDATLIVCVARRLGASSNWIAEWTGAVDAADLAFEDHLEAFLPLARQARRIIKASRPDLDLVEPELWRTLLKHRSLVDFLTELEAPAAIHRITDHDVRAMLDLADRVHGPVTIPVAWAKGEVRAFPRRTQLPEPLVLAAAQSKAEPTTYAPALRWRSPQGDVDAYLSLPVRTAQVPDSFPVRLNLTRVADGEVATALARGRVRLAGLERQLDASARADFTIGELRGATEELVLIVEDVPWDAVREKPKDSIE